MTNEDLSHDEFVSLNDVLGEEKKKITKCSWIYYVKMMKMYCVSCKENIAYKKFKCQKN